MRHGHRVTARRVVATFACAAIAGAVVADVVDRAGLTRDFRVVHDGRYTLAFREIGIAFDIDRLRRDRHELIGELTVRSTLPGSRTVASDVLSCADFNLSSARARLDRARLLADRARLKVDFTLLVEEFCHLVISAERTGGPAVQLRDVPRPDPEDVFDVDGIRLLKRHPTVIFGDGGEAKSLTALYLAGRLAQRGVAVLFADWEFAGEDHRDRFERLFGADMPDLLYVRCDRPLVSEGDRLRRLVRDHGVEYAVFDSVAFACDGPPEAAEVASSYYRAVRQIGVGSLHIAHTSKAEGADQKPFGSTFWHNGARSTWYAKRAAASPDNRQITIGLFNRKTNIGPLRSAVGYEITFGTDQTTFEPVHVADVQDLAERLPLWQRMAHLLRGGSLPIAAIADELGEKVDRSRRLSSAATANCSRACPARTASTAWHWSNDGASREDWTLV